MKVTPGDVNEDTIINTNITNTTTLIRILLMKVTPGDDGTAKVRLV